MNPKIDVEDQEENNPYPNKKLQCHVLSSGVSYYCSPINQAAELLKESYENLRRLRRLQRGHENQQESLISNYTDVRRTIVSMYLSLRYHCINVSYSQITLYQCILLLDTIVSMYLIDM